jgi:hypothetical protein
VPQSLKVNGILNLKSLSDASPVVPMPNARLSGAPLGVFSE